MKVADLLDELEGAHVLTRGALRKALKREPTFLRAVLRACFRQGQSQQVFDGIWRTVLSKQ